jgi:hypothetical protein
MNRAFITLFGGAIGVVACAGTPVTGGDLQTRSQKDDLASPYVQAEQATAVASSHHSGDGTRLKRLYDVAEDGAQEDSNAWWDSSRSEACRFTVLSRAGADVRICRPALPASSVAVASCASGGGGPGQPPPPPPQYYSDASCTDVVSTPFPPGATYVTPGDPLPKYVSSETAGSGLAEAGGRAQVYCLRDGNGCCAATGTCGLLYEYVAKGSDIPASAFVAFRTLHD